MSWFKNVINSFTDSLQAVGNLAIGDVKSAKDNWDASIRQGNQALGRGNSSDFQWDIAAGALVAGAGVGYAAGSIQAASAQKAVSAATASFNASTIKTATEEASKNLISTVAVKSSSIATPATVVKPTGVLATTTTALKDTAGAVSALSVLSSLFAPSQSPTFTTFDASPYTPSYDAGATYTPSTPGTDVINDMNSPQTEAVNFMPIILTAVVLFAIIFFMKKGK